MPMADPVSTRVKLTRSTERRVIRNCLISSNLKANLKAIVFTAAFRRRHMKTFQCVSSYSLYVISIMTNQGKISDNLLFVNKESK